MPYTTASKQGTSTSNEVSAASVPASSGASPLPHWSCVRHTMYKRRRANVGGGLLPIAPFQTHAAKSLPINLLLSNLASLSTS